MELKKIKYEAVPNRALIVYFLECIKDYFYPNYFSKVDVHWGWSIGKVAYLLFQEA